jgi:hypothetical protein
MSVEAAVRGGFASAGVSAALVDELFGAFTLAKRRFHRGDLRPNAVEGGRFSEGAFRIVQWVTTGAVTPIGKTLPKVPDLLKTLESTGGYESLCLHIPRALRVIYDIRNKRNVAHLGNGIDPNFQDATLVCTAWTGSWPSPCGSTTTFRRTRPTGSSSTRLGRTFR